MKLFAGPYKWLLLTQNDTYLSSANIVFVKYNIYPDSNVVISLKTGRNAFDLYEIYKYGKHDITIAVNNISKWILREGFQKPVSRILSTERRNLNGTVLPSAVVILFNDTFNHLTDYR